jgi:cytochrome P450
MNNPKYFPDPERFDPNRWLKNPSPEAFAFIPFLAGPRNCIGQHISLVEAKMMLTYFLKSFDFKIKENY